MSFLLCRVSRPPPKTAGKRKKEEAMFNQETYLGFDEMADPHFRHDGDGHGIDNLLDHVGVTLHICVEVGTLREQQGTQQNG